jgi:hypothetical protein
MVLSWGTVSCVGERVEVELDEATRVWLRRTCAQRGGTVAQVAAEQLRQLALQDAVSALGAWYDAHPCSAEDSAEAELRAS